MKERKGVDLSGRGGREELGGIVGEKLIRIYCTRKELFSIKGKNENANKTKKRSLRCDVALY